MARDDGRATETGGRVRALRRERSLSIRDLSKKSGVSPDAIVKLEHGARAARPSTVRKVAEALGVGPRYLLEGRKDAPAQGEMMLALAARGRADAEGRDAREVYRELRENPPSLEQILGG
ncbi:MAG: helix-turn-helix transcriptional regulator, partial [Actinomycetota bacterium]|nr:helix-turn-helix transcriptional regulator [Actinomycetota bacterium]